MSLEFNQVIDPLHKMVYYKKKLSESEKDRLQTALALYRTVAGDLPFVHQRIKLARRPDISGYRGAAPLDVPYDEVANAHTIAAEPPPQAVILAADGSQIYPNYDSPTLYYLINIGIFAYYHGQERLPTQWTKPELVYTEELVKDSQKQLISGRTVNSRRTVEEMRALGAKSWELRRADTGLIIALHDGNLLKFFGGDDVEDGGGLLRDYIGTLVQLHDANTVLAGYVDNPRRSTSANIYLIELKLDGGPSIYRRDQNLVFSGPNIPNPDHDQGSFNATGTLQPGRYVFSAFVRTSTGFSGATGMSPGSIDVTLEIPAPAAGTLLAAGGVLALRRRRRTLAGE